MSSLFSWFSFSMFLFIHPPTSATQATVADLSLAQFSSGLMESIFVCRLHNSGVFHVAPGLCHLDYSFRLFKISHKLNFCFIYLFLLKITVLCIVIHTVKNVYNLYVTLCKLDLRRLTIELFTCVLSNESKTILCMKGKVINTATCYG